MSAMKRFMEQVSIDLGYGGRINEEVTKTANEKLPSIANLIELIPKQTPINVNTLGKMYLVLFTETTLNLFFFSI